MSENPFKSGDVIFADLWYPDRGNGAQDTNELTVNAVEVGLCCVRAADAIRIVYDFERDGYSIRQASVFEWDADDEVMDADWQEVAFIKAWAREAKRHE